MLPFNVDRDLGDTLWRSILIRFCRSLFACRGGIWPILRWYFLVQGLLKSGRAQIQIESAFAS